MFDDRLEQLRELRCVLGEALARDDAAAIADGYLAVAQLLGGERRFAAAASQLEEGIELLTADHDMIADDRSAAVSRLRVAWTALHEAGVARQSDPARARSPSRPPAARRS